MTHVPRAPAQPAKSVPAAPRSRLKLNLEKCQIFQKEIRYLRHTVSPEGITTNPNKLKAIWEWPTPKNKHRIKPFPGLCTDYKWFISGFAKRCETADQIHGEEASLSVEKFRPPSKH
jgi:hypothetical protein